MGKPRRKWPDHPLVGKDVTYKRAGRTVPAKIVDAKPGPMMVDTSTFDQPEAKIYGTLLLKLQDLQTGLEFWAPPMQWDGTTGVGAADDKAQAVANG